MAKKLTKDIKKKFILNKGYEIQPVVLLGIKCSFDNLFIDWLIDESDNQNIDLKKEKCPCCTLSKIAVLKSVDLPIALLNSSEVIYLDNDDCIIGVNLIEFDERKSLKRMRIEVYDALVKLGIMNDNDKLDWINLYTDMLIYNKKNMGDILKDEQKEK